MLPRKKPSIFSLLLTVALVTTPKLLDLVSAQPVYAQSPTPSSFPLPSTLPTGSTVRVDGSESMAVINQLLKQRFESQYAGTTVELANQGTDAALQALLDGKIDLAAIGRPLTDEERGQGFVETPISREKIAIILGADNPFQGNLNFDQFAGIFRGEITDWSEVGGSPGPIRLVDRPDSSDTRKALSAYSVFKVAPFATGANATQVSADDTAAVVSQLGRDGISYAIAGQVLDRSDVRIISMHGTLPDDPRYPYSQPRSYVYKDTASPVVQAFLGYATSPAGQQAVAEAKSEEAAVVAGSTPSPSGVEASPAAVSSATVSPTAPSSTASSSTVPSSPSPDAVPSTTSSAAGSDPNAAGWLPWLLLPLIGGGLLFWGWKRRGDQGATPDEVAPAVPPPAPSEPTLADRMGSVIAADRSSLPQRSPTTTELPNVEISATPATPVVLPTPGLEVNASSASTFTPPLGAVGGIVAAGAGAAAVAGLAGLGRDRRSRIVLTPRTVNQGYAYWEVPEAEKAVLKQQGGERLTLRVEDVTGLETSEVPHNTQQYDCAESDFDRFVVLPQPERDYVAEIGYLTPDNSWLSLARSAPVHVAATLPVSLTTAIEPDSTTTVGEATTVIQEQPTLIQAETAIPEEPTSVQAVDPEFQAESTSIPEEITSIQPEEETLLLPNIAIAGGAALAAGAALVPGPELEADDATNLTEVEAETQSASRMEVGETAAVADAESVIEEIATDSDEALLIYGTIDEPLPTSPDVSEVPVEFEAETTIEAVLEPEEDPTVEWPSGPVNLAIAGGAVLAAGAAMASEPTERERAQSTVEATKFDVGQVDLSSDALASVDEGLPDLVDGYGDSWITLLPRDPQWAYAYWDVPDQHKQALRQQGGQRLALRFYDVTAIDLSHQNPHSLQQYDCDELARDWYIPVPVSDRDYIVEIGYVAEDGRWLMLARSNAIRVPPVHPANWYEEQFITVDWDEDLSGRTFLELSPPDQQKSFGNPLYDRIFGLAESAESQRVTGSLFGSMQQVPPEAASSFALGSGAGLAARTESGMGMSGAGLYSQSGVGMMSGAGLYSQSGVGMMSGIGMAGQFSAAGMSGVGMSGIGLFGAAGMSGVGMSGIGLFGVAGMSGIGMSGVGMYSQSGAGAMGMSGIGMMSGIGLYSQSGMGMMSGVGFSASMPPVRSRKFWLIADAELIIYGATEPDATVTIAGRPVQLNPDGTFRFHLSFQDGLIDFPILAIAADGEQSRSVHMTFTRETPSRHTNTPDEARDEFF